MSDYNLYPSTRILALHVGREIARELLDQLRCGELPLAPEYLTARQVTQLTGFSPKALESMRARREGPPYFKVGNSVRYRVADVRAWIEKGGQQ